ncbi:MAG: TIGR03013 family XrtA/PEP-CTERM system glycosyltransferase [Terriglobia bacterium]
MIRALHGYLPPRVLALGLGEVLIIGACFVLATLLRLGSDAYFELQYLGGFFKIGLVCFVCVLCLYFYDLYDPHVFANKRELVSRAPQVVGTAMILLGLLYYMYPPLGIGRGIFVLGIPLLGLGLIGYRMGFLWLTHALPFAENTLVLGEGVLAHDLAKEIRRRPELGLRFVGLVNDNSQPPAPGNGARELPVVGTPAQLVSLVAERDVQRLIVAMQDRRGKLPIEELLRLKARGIFVDEGTSLYESLSGKIALASLKPGWLVFAQGFAISRLQESGMRLLSVAVAGIGLLFFGPVMLLLALLNKLEGAVLYRQERVGQHGRVFRLTKFRSMHDDAESHTGPVWAQEHDPRITRLGRLMRKWRLDELPQFLNVLRGDMNVVGPRPERPCFVEELRQKIPFYDYRHMVKPGITGWAQVNFHYADSELSTMEKLQYDLFYCKNRSLGLDLLILFHTAKIVLLGRGAH